MNFDSEARPIPACYQSSAEAFEAYNAACQNGFDGDYNTWLEMEQFHIERDSYVNDIKRGVEGLSKMGQRPLLRDIGEQILDEAS